jgi:hypothetical protein
VWFPSGVGNNPLVITKLDLPGAAKFSARKTSVLGCVNVWDDIVPHCSNVPYQPLALQNSIFILLQHKATPQSRRICYNSLDIMLRILMQILTSVHF